MQTDPVDLVNCYTGSSSPKSGGNCLIGPYRPFGLVRIGPDALHLNRTNNGYYKGLPIQRFSHTHVAGTGGPPRYGNIGVTPFTGGAEPRNIAPFLCPPLERSIDAMPTREEAAVGRFAVNLRPWNVYSELTCTKHVGVHRYTFPKGESAHLYLDPSDALRSQNIKPANVHTFQPWDSCQGSVGGQLDVVSETEITGRSDIRGGWGHDKTYSIFFYLKSNRPFTRIQITNDGGILPARVGAEAVGTGIKCVLDYGPVPDLELQVGISFISVAQARSHVEKETAGKSFDAVVAECRKEWSDLLSAFRIRGGTLEQQQTFYSLLYRLFCMPTDLGVDEENPNWKSGVRQFTDYYCLWDSVRNANSFFTLFFPEISRDMLHSLIDIADHTGWVPDAHIANHPAFMQSACAADIIFPEAQAKGVTGVDYGKALAHLRKNNEVKSPDPMVAGRYTEDYNTLGYLSTRVKKGSVSRHLEYTYHDWCLSQMARRLGEKDVAATYLENAKRIWNLWRDETKTFFPRNADGTWLEGYEPWVNPPEGWNDASCYEGSTAVWSFNAFQDFAEHIRRVGGPVAYLSLLDSLWEKGLFHIKETRMHIPHLYTYAGRPDRAADRVLANLATFKPTPDGLTDNEDMGCQAGYFLWQSMGLYPIYGQTHYMLTPPLFDDIQAPIGGGKLHITVDRQGQGKYITACLLGGEPIHRAWVEHRDLVGRKTLHFVLGDKPTGWGEKELPPSGIERSL